MKHLTTALIALGLSGTSAMAQDIGVVSSIEPQLQGKPPGQSTRALRLGTGVVQDEQIQSSTAGRGQLMFRDQTTLTIAPNSTIVLDEFVYNPNQGTGELGLSLTKGALRFIGGRITKRNEGRIQTPSATIGIRGGSALILHRNGRTRAVFLSGERLCIYRAGERSCTTRSGGVLSEDGYEGVASRASLRELLALIDGPAGGGNGPTQGGRVGADDVAPADRNSISPTGKEFEGSIFNDRVTDGAITNVPKERVSETDPEEEYQEPIEEEPIYEEPVVEDPIEQSPGEGNLIIEIPEETDPDYPEYYEGEILR
jgi:hypothetical protein